MVFAGESKSFVRKTKVRSCSASWYFTRRTFSGYRFGDSPVVNTPIWSAIMLLSRSPPIEYMRLNFRLSFARMTKYPSFRLIE